MFTKDHEAMFAYLQEKYCLPQGSVQFVNDISGWCRSHGLRECDTGKPVRLILTPQGGCQMLVLNVLSDDVIQQQMNALSIRSQGINVAVDPSERLNSDRKKLAYIFLSEYATGLPEIGSDERLADEWAIKEMERLEFFKS